MWHKLIPAPTKGCLCFGEELLPGHLFVQKNARGSLRNGTKGKCKALPSFSSVLTVYIYIYRLFTLTSTSGNEGPFYCETGSDGFDVKVRLLPIFI